MYSMNSNIFYENLCTENHKTQLKETNQAQMNVEKLRSPAR